MLVCGLKFETFFPPKYEVAMLLIADVLLAEMAMCYPISV